MSELRRIAADLVSGLRESTRVADELTAAARRADQLAAWTARLAARSPGLGAVAATLHAAAAQCRTAAARLDEAGRTGTAWARALAGAPSGGAGQAGGGGQPPLGFPGDEAFARFGATLRGGLSLAGHDGVTPILQGSSVTGASFRTGRPFGEHSDYDVALASPDLLARAAAIGIPLRSGGTRTGPLRAADLARLGLSGLARELSSSVSRPVNFMIYESVDSAVGRSGGTLVP